VKVNESADRSSAHFLIHSFTTSSPSHTPAIANMDTTEIERNEM
jgi:hypothetical protein